MAEKPINVLITGANRGMGLEMVRQMVETQGPVSKVFACCRKPKKAEELQKLAATHPGIIKLISLDATDLKSIKKAATEVGSLVGKNGLNLIINNAAVAHLGTFFQTTREQMQSCFITNAEGPMHIIQEFHPYLLTAAKNSGIAGMSCRKAAVISISTFISVVGTAKDTYAKFPGLPYRVSKAALNMVMACAAAEFQKDEILCTMLHPGWVRTAMGGDEGELEASESVKSMFEVMKSMTHENHGQLMDYKGNTLPL